MSNPLIDRVAVTELLIAAVSLVLRCAQDRDLEAEVLLLIATPSRSVVPRRIVDDQDFDALECSDGMRLRLSRSSRAL